MSKMPGDYFLPNRISFGGKVGKFQEREREREASVKNEIKEKKEENE